MAAFSAAGYIFTSSISGRARMLLEHFDAESTHTGRLLSKRGSEALPVVWGCKQVLEQDIAKLPLDAFQRTGDGGRRKAIETPQHQLTRIRPNPEQTPSQFKGILQAFFEYESRFFLTGGAALESPYRLRAGADDGESSESQFAGVGECARGGDDCSKT